MLIRFNVSNFLSFDEMQEFSMISGKVRSKVEHVYDDKSLKLLKFAAIYGANAAGKSNLITAIDFAKSTIVEKLPNGYSNKYHKTKQANKDKISYFEFEIKIKDKYYAYGFEIILYKGSIVSEWLIELSETGMDKEIFTRDTVKGVYQISQNISEELYDRLNIYAQDVASENSKLFLTIMNENKSDLYEKYQELELYKIIYNWFKNQLDVNYPDKPVSNYSYFMVEKNADEICDIISAFGTGISKFKMVEANIETIAKRIPKAVLEDIVSDLEKESKKLKEQKAEGHIGVLFRGRKEFFVFNVNKDDEVQIKTIEFEHFNSESLFSLSEESDGTRRLLDLIEVLLVGNDGKTYIIDEIDRCLHPQLTYKLIETYFKLTQRSPRQLIVTTHESHLLDFDLLRRDEIWFIDKDKQGHSSLYSLEAYNERFDKKIDKAYLEGRYGGVPVFSSIFPMKGE